VAPPTSLRNFLDGLFSESGGSVSFERFMAEALYHPEFGYYTHHIRTVGGSRGDFATSATLSSLLGESIAAWIRAEIESLGLAPPIHLIEIGGGEGSLMRDVITALDAGKKPWWRRSRPRFHFHLVEISPRLRARQQETLKAMRRSITWHDSVESALAAADGQAILFSNELVDAFPVRLLRWVGHWSEVLVSFDPAEGLREHFARPIDLDRDRFSVLREPEIWPSGQRVELHESYRRWWEKWSPALKCGALLTIDYGASAADLYRKRPEGTLRAYFRHQRLTGAGIYRLFGQQDITADVCFDDLIDWGVKFGFSTTHHLSQAEFLRSFAPKKCAGLAASDRAAAFLLDPDGAGGAFRALAQRKSE
jgi:SAM-dependent MidA family methyltransferase